MKPAHAFVTIALAASFACAREPAPTPDSRRPAPAAGTCDEVAARWSSTLAKGTGACVVDDDCRCFYGGIEKAHGCGGVAERATADALEKIRGEFENAKCRSGISCAAWACAPKCVAGRCGN